MNSNADAPAHALPGSGPRVLMLSALDRWVFQNFIPSLRRLCSRVYAFPMGETMGNWHLPDWPRLRRKLVDRLISDCRELVRGPGLDMVFTVVYDDTLRPEDVRKLRALGVRVVTYHVDMNAQWYRVLRHGPELDLLAVSHMQNIEPLIRRGVVLHFMPMAASPDRYLIPGEPNPGAGPDAPGVLMLGSANNSRARVVAACRDLTDRVDVYGAGWERLVSAGGGGVAASVENVAPRPLVKRRFDAGYLLPRLMAEGTWFFRRFREEARTLDPQVIRTAASANHHGEASDELAPLLMSRAAITLGVTQRRGEIGDRFGFCDSRLRDFEAPLAGAFYLVQSYVDLPLFYSPGSEVETWSTLDELRSKVRYFLGRDRERAAIAAAGRERARREHTWDHRLRALFHRLGLAAAEGSIMCPLRVIANYSARSWCESSPGCRSNDDPALLAPGLEAMIGP